MLKRIGILYHPMMEAASNLAGDLESFLRARGVSVWLCSAWESEEAGHQVDDTDLILTTGGDGTILRAVQVALPAQTPITGINLGKLGFMTELTAGEALDMVPALLAGDGWIDERAMLQAELSTSVQEQGAAQTFHALNDVVVARGAIARIVHIDVRIDGEPLTTYRVDGVIVSTATGSTGYALSAGGPILYPQAEDFMVLPILPHISSAYALVLPSTSVVRLCVSSYHQPTLSVDGHINLLLSSGAIVTVRHSSKRARFLRIHPRRSFYGTLEQRLKGKQMK